MAVDGTASDESSFVSLTAEGEVLTTVRRMAIGSRKRIGDRSVFALPYFLS